MAMSLHFKRAKSFVAVVDGGTRKFLAQPGYVAQTVPGWVADTETFKRGVEDGSIVNLTPPALMPGYKAPKAEPAPEPSAEEVAMDAAEPDVEQTEMPKAPFGINTDKPVSAPKGVGAVRATAKKG